MFAVLAILSLSARVAATSSGGSREQRRREGNLMRVIDALAQDVGVLGVFSDWASPATFYANCMGLK